MTSDLNLRYLVTEIGIASFCSLFTLSCTHPLDTVRIRMQVESQPNMLRTITETYRGEGFRGFYKGMMSPIMGATPQNTLVFTVCETVRR